MIEATQNWIRTQSQPRLFADIPDALRDALARPIILGPVATNEGDPGEPERTLRAHHNQTVERYGDLLLDFLRRRQASAPSVLFRHPRLLRALSIAMATLLLDACAVGPDFERSGAPDVSGYTREPLTQVTASTDVAGGEAQRFVPGLDIPGQWWVLFHSEPLNLMIEQAIRNNPTLPAAQAALRQARENVYAEQGAFFPSITVNFSPSRNKTATGALSPISASGNPFYSLYTGQVTVTYAPDVFGGTRRQVESLEATAEFQRFQVEATYLTLTSNVVAAAVQEASLRGQIAATEEIIKIETESLSILQKQFELGQVANADVAAVEATLAQAQATLPPLQKQLAVQRDLLTALIGRFPSQEPAEKFELAALRLPQDLPVSLPSKLVEQRPDIQSAEAQLHAASAQIGVAVAAQLPQFTLTGNAGAASNQISQFLATPGTAFWAVAGNVAQTIFDAGTLLHKKRAAEAAFDQAAAMYRGTVITAFQNVADTLHALKFDADTLKAAYAAERAAAKSLEIARRQLQLGAITYLGLLTTQNTYQTALIAQVQAQATRYADTAALFQALGGGWWNRTDVVPPKAWDVDFIP
jgi:NodT family efflux transporter outer membrane factor (OMF) lipoprotein